MSGRERSSPFSTVAAPGWGMEGLLGIHYGQERSVTRCAFCAGTSFMHSRYEVITIIMVDNAIIF